MAITVYYDSTHDQEGTPEPASHKEFKKLGPNSVYTATEVEEDAGSFFVQTPCAQNYVNGFALIDGPYNAYDVVVGVTGLVVERATITGAGRFTGGLAWRITDDQSLPVADGRVRAGALPASSPNSVPFAATYAMRIPNGIKTRVCGCNSAGGITIPVSATPFYVSIKVDVTLAWWVQPMVGLISVGGTGIQVPVPVPAVPGIVVPGGDLSFSNLLLRNIGVLGGGFLTAPNFQRSGEDFQDPELRKQIGLASDALELPDTQERLERVRQTIGKPFRER